MQLLARGRAADVYDLGDGTVLRRYRIAVDSLREATAMAWLAEHGVPVPRVVSADGPDMVMERVDGVSMLADLQRRPWLIRRHGRTLAALHRALDAVPAPDGLPEPYGPGSGVLHRDLHPDNVLLTARGPVLIDWSNVARGPRAADVAESWLLNACGTPQGGALIRVLTVAGRQAFLQAFLSGVDTAAAAPYLAAVVAHRRHDPNMSAAELAAMQRIADRHTPT